MLYIAWAAARTPTMRSLFQRWIDELPEGGEPVEAPPAWTEKMTDRVRLHHMSHDTLGFRDDVHPDEVDALRERGWRFVVNAEDFGELLHVQARYFYERFFPRLSWLILDAPTGEHFVLGDRPVVWGVGGNVDCPPSALRSRFVQLVSPLSGSLALAAYHPLAPTPERVHVGDVNRAMSVAAMDWIAGPTSESVLEALELRRSGMSGAG